jgi:thioredoxin reductase (NADPH)
LVVGGGDSAVEYACELSCCNDVTLNYRKETLARPNPANQKMIAQYVQNQTVTLRLGEDIEGLEAEHGQVKVLFANGNEKYDRVIYAIGGTTPKDFLKSCGIALDESGEPIFDENYETQVKGLYIAGDIAFRNGGSIAIALNHGYKIVSHILRNKI